VLFEGPLCGLSFFLSDSWRGPSQLVTAAAPLGANDAWIQAHPNVSEEDP